MSTLTESASEIPTLRRRAGMLRGEWPAERLRQFAPLLMLVVLCLGVGLANPRFFTWANASAIAEASAVPLIVGMALTLVVLTGSIDLSVEGVMGLVAVVVALLVTNHGHAGSVVQPARRVLHAVRRQSGADPRPRPAPGGDWSRRWHTDHRDRCAAGARAVLLHSTLDETWPLR